MNVLFLKSALEEYVFFFSLFWGGDDDDDWGGCKHEHVYFHARGWPWKAAI